MAETPAKYHIIGAGIAGLYTAQLIRKKYPKAEINIYEAAAHAGGRCCSFYDTKLGLISDNATHVILKGNHRAAKLLGTDNFQNRALFRNFASGKISGRLWHNLDDKALALFNQSLNKTAPGIVFKTFCKLFPFNPGKLKLWFSQSDLTKKLIEPLAQNLNVKKGWKLQSISEKNKSIYKLVFNKGSIALLPQDRIISALDAANYGKIFGGAKFEFNEIINIFYRTSMQISLPGGQSCLGINGAATQWLFASPGLLAATISAAKLKISDEDLARTIWEEISVLRGHPAAFMPPYRVLHHKRATIRQDKTNNAMRPGNCQTPWRNLLLAGDWTMKNWPCSIEAALVSAERAVRKL